MSDDEAFDSAQILLKRKDAQEELDELLEASSSDAPGAMVVLTAEESSSLTPEEREALALVEPRITASAAAREQVRNARARRMEELRTVLSSTELEWQLVRATQELIRTRYDRNELLVAKLEAAFGEWARAHGALVAGIEGTSLPDFESLAQTATEIQDVLSRPRN